MKKIKCNKKMENIELTKSYNDKMVTLKLIRVLRYKAIKDCKIRASIG